MQQTSVEWLISKQKHNQLFDIETIEQAKTMNEEEIKNAYNAAYWGDVLKFETSEEYFNKTFKQ
jgi:hypothetical protein